MSHTPTFLTEAQRADPRVLTEAQRAEIIARIRRGESMASVARHLGISRSSLGSILAGKERKGTGALAAQALKHAKAG
jgi:lambda repressor-like predicted transcriptional regulator